MLCSDVMKKRVEATRPEASVRDAAIKMRDKGVGFLPVIDEHGSVLGTLTDRDLALRVCTADWSPAEVKVAGVMTDEVIACRPGDDLARAEALMSTHHKSRVMCIDDKGHLVGVISLSDVAQRDGAARAAVTLRHVTEREV